MKGRCNNKNDDRYTDYGGRGIKYDPKWEKFDGFWEDMEEGYADNLSLDRIDVNGDYTKENCRWATSKQQSRNMRNNVCLTFNGKTQTLPEWAEELGIKGSTLACRYKRGWSDERILTQKKGNYAQKFLHDGKYHTMQEWSAILGLDRSTIISRLSRGWSWEEIKKNRRKECLDNAQSVTRFSEAKTNNASVPIREQGSAPEKPQKG